MISRKRCLVRGNLALKAQNTLVPGRGGYLRLVCPGRLPCCATRAACLLHDVCCSAALRAPGELQPHAGSSCWSLALALLQLEDPSLDQTPPVACPYCFLLREALQMLTHSYYGEPVAVILVYETTGASNTFSFMVYEKKLATKCNNEPCFKFTVH